MITIILCKGKGLDSEELSLFEQEKIAGISLFERSLISLSNESFTESFIISDKEYPLNELYKRHKNFNIQTKPKIDDLDRYVTALDSHSFEYDLWKFQLKFLNEFFNNGRYVDVEISHDKMKNFLINEKDTLEPLTEQYLKKINKINESNN